jgi:hypothetical protein
MSGKPQIDNDELFSKPTAVILETLIKIEQMHITS